MSEFIVREKLRNGEWDDGEEFSSEWSELEYVAEDYLKNEYENRDGWEYFQSEDDTKEIQVEDVKTGEKEEFIINISYEVRFHANKKE